MCNTAREIEAATQPLSHSAKEAGPATQPLSHSGRVAEWLSGCGKVAGAATQHSATLSD